MGLVEAFLFFEYQLFPAPQAPAGEREPKSILMGLFDQLEQQHLQSALPLAARMRPTSLSEFAGQQHFLAPGKLLYRMLQADRISSVIFYGPPGTGKTTLAQLMASHTSRKFVSLNAAASGVKELRNLLENAKDRLMSDGGRTVLFIDELHRFNRAQQDVLLPDVESGIVTLIGATTANPFFSLVSPLISRSQIFEFQPLSKEETVRVLTSALNDKERGLSSWNVSVDPDALDFLADISDGDARRALNALEVAVLSVANAENHVDLHVAEESIQKKAISYDAQGDEHYDAASAFIKSIRGSDPDAALYWMARMLEAGEDPRFIARRIVISAAEDIGNADPQGLILANAAAQATEMVGMPECRIILAQAVTYLASAPKSNAAYLAIDAALDDVRNKRLLPVPIHLKDTHYRGAEQLGHGKGYQYSHAATEGWVPQDYLGVEKSYYHPVERGAEIEIKRRLERLRKKREQHQQESAANTQDSSEHKDEETTEAE